MNSFIDEFDELIELIKTSNIYKEYIRLESLVKESVNINILVDEIKILQKEIVNKEYKKQDIVELEKELSNKKVELSLIPLYNEYVDKLEELNNVLLIIKNKFDKFIEELLL